MTRINVVIPNQGDIFAEMTPKELNRAQAEEARRLGQAIQNMRKRKCDPVFEFDYFDKHDELIEGFARTMIAIAQLMIQYRLSDSEIQSRVREILKDRRWGFIE